MFSDGSTVAVRSFGLDVKSCLRAWVHPLQRSLFRSQRLVELPTVKTSLQVNPSDQHIDQRHRRQVHGGDVSEVRYARPMVGEDAGGGSPISENQIVAPPVAYSTARSSPP